MTESPQVVEHTSWPRHLGAAAVCSLGGLVVHLLEPFLPAPIALVGLGIGVVAASFMLAWAADAGEAVFSGGLVLTAVSLVTVLPEFVIEIRFAFIQAAELVTANLTGATRLLLVGSLALPVIVLELARRSGRPAPHLQLAPTRRLELGVLLIASVVATLVAVRGSLSVLEGVLLVGLYALYARRVQGTAGEEPAVVGVGAGLLSLPPPFRRPAIGGLVLWGGFVVVVIANPFADALLHTGQLVGLDPYLLIQSVVPAATESPEFVVVAVLVVNRRPAQAMALLLASAVAQWTLGLGLLPFAYMAGGGGPSMPLAAREQLELAFTITVTLFVVAAFCTLRPRRVDSALVIGAFLVQLIYPVPLVRLVVGFVLLVFALDILASQRRQLRPLLATVLSRRRPG